jgi:hypothetical protein
MIDSSQSRLPRLILVAAIVTLVASFAIPAVAQGPPWVSFKVNGEFTRKALRACGKSKNFRVFHARSQIEARGFVTPPPAKHFPAVIKVKKCTRGHFVTFAKYHVVGKKLTGKVKAFFPAPRLPRASRGHRRVRIVFYRATGVFNGAESAPSYFAVVR